MTSLAITFREPGGQPLSVVMIDDAELLRLAARRALECAELKTALTAYRNPVAGRCQAAEVRRLREVLEVLVPDLVADRETVPK